ncbi:MAG: DNA translocase FtsK [Chloroflexi bacterium]|nr:DNA translocase FtsK [Chloroflexota bacterium]
MAKQRRTRKKKSSFHINLSGLLRADRVGIALLALALLTLLSLLALSRGTITEGWLHLLCLAFGWGAYLTPLMFGAVGLWLLLKGSGRQPQVAWEKVVGIVLLFALGLALVHLLPSNEDPRAWAAQGGGGGYLGWLISWALVSSLGDLGAYVAIIALASVAIIVLSGLSPAEMGQALRQGWSRLRYLGQRRLSRLRRRSEMRPSIAPSPEPATEPPRPARGPIFPRIIGGDREWRLPPVAEIMEDSLDQEISQAEIRRRVKIIEDTLVSLGVPAKVVEVNQGPVITQFGVEPGFVEGRAGRRMKVKVSKISALADDLALALAASPVRVEAPVPGRSIVGIEVPNAELTLVALRGVMESEAFRKLNSKLAIALGRDVSGEPIVADLGTMPHLLIAGATGSGKSVCINSIIACLLCNSTPDDLKLLMIDPKRVELTNFNGIPHLQAPVIVDLERVVGSLQWVTREMDQRYKKLARAEVRNIEEYNKRASARGEGRLPYLVVFVDELADLMMLAHDEVERSLCRIAQMARATGIHLVIATQRPSVDVVTGLIKANFPARISFAVTSQVDSRVVLDMGGAERLLGRGDMLYMASDSSQLVRLQGCFVSDRELDRLVRYWKGTEVGASVPTSFYRAEEMTQQPLWEEMRIKEEEASRRDDLLEEAIAVVREYNRASISLLQRRLRIGYSRAARLIDLLEEQGVVGPDQGAGRSREVLTGGEIEN